MIKGSPAAFEISDAMATAAQKTAEIFGVVPAIHENDHLFAHCLKASQKLETIVSDYLVGGHHDAQQVKEVIDKLTLGPDAKVLEFAAGYGRVTRHFHLLMPGFEFFASDIHLEAQEFIRNQLGAATISSNSDPEKFHSPESFDFIFVLSLFSHLPERSFGSWIRALAASLKPNGFLMFTTHGEFAAALHHSFSDPVDPSTGFGFIPQSEQPDLSVEEYGTTIVFPRYVISKCNEVGLRLQFFESGKWFGLQDGWVFKAAA